MEHEEDPDVAKTNQCASIMTKVLPISHLARRKPVRIKEVGHVKISSPMNLMFHTVLEELQGHEAEVLESWCSPRHLDHCDHHF